MGKKGLTLPYMTSPGDLGGVFSWNNICCPASYSWGVLMVECALDCSCGGCDISGSYWYEGYVLPFVSSAKCPCSGGSEGGGDPGSGQEPESNHETSIDIVAVQPAVIFEDEYRNDGQTLVPRRSSFCEIRCTYDVVGDGTLTFAAQSGGDKIVLHEGSPQGAVVSMPKTWNLTDGSTGAISFFAEGVLESLSLNDVVMALSFAPSGGEPVSKTASVTSVRLESNSTAQSPEFSTRHIYGSLEDLLITWYPIPVPITWSVSGGGNWKSIEVDRRTLTMPPKSGSVTISASVGGATFQMPFNVVEPEAIIATFMNPMAGNVENVAGDIGMELLFTLYPTNVSFANLRVREIPTQEGDHIGYFDLFGPTNWWYHTESNGAGNWINVLDNNVYAVDRAFIPECPPPWINGTLTWIIPNEWQAQSQYPQVQGTNVFFTCEQIFTINEEGTVSVSKLGHTITRMTNNVVTIDGVIQ